MKFTVATVLAFAAVAFAYPAVERDGTCEEDAVWGDARR